MAARSRAKAIRTDSCSSSPNKPSCSPKIYTPGPLQAVALTEDRENDARATQAGPLRRPLRQEKPQPRPRPEVTLPLSIGGEPRPSRDRLRRHPASSLRRGLVTAFTCGESPGWRSLPLSDPRPSHECFGDVRRLLLQAFTRCPGAADPTAAGDVSQQFGPRFGSIEPPSSSLNSGKMAPFAGKCSNRGDR
jgi:hypothetical protein